MFCLFTDKIKTELQASSANYAKQKTVLNN